MSAIKQCDRCKVAYDPFNISDYNDETWRYGISKDCHPYLAHKFDLCLECRKELVEWLNNK